MNRNVESHFANIPQAHIPRSIFDRSCGLKTSFNVGELIPIYLQEILPGDTVKMTSSKVIRLQTLLTPIFDNMYLDVYWFFVPNRLVWDHWQEFCGENSSSPWKQETVYQIPTIKCSGGWEVGSTADYLGIPVNQSFNGTGLEMSVSAIPFRDYALICRDWFTDENLTYPVDVYTGDEIMDADNVDESNYVEATQYGFHPFKVAKYHDRFTSALPAPQKHEPIGIGYGASLSPVFAATNMATDFSGSANRMGHIVFNTGKTAVGAQSYRNVYFDQTGFITSSIKGSKLVMADQDLPTAYEDQGEVAYPVNLFADTAVGLNSITINQLRYSFQLQKFYEKLARGGSRYVEIIRSFFGVTSPDARMQRPEYLGGNRIPINVYQVSNNAQAGEAYLGDVGANSVTSDVHFDFVHSFVEHGYLFGLCCARYTHTYSGLDRHWNRKLFQHFYWPTFANLGEQGIYNGEVFYKFDPQNPGTRVPSAYFGYQEAWSEYRYGTNKVTGEMRPNVPNTLASWHLADDYEEMPVLSDEWIREDKTNVDRVLAVTSKVSHQIFADMYFKTIWTRPLPVYSVPGLIDHW